MILALSIPLDDAVAVVGARLTGKSTLVRGFCDNDDNTDDARDGAVAFATHTVADGEEISLEVIDDPSNVRSCAACAPDSSVNCLGLVIRLSYPTSTLKSDTPGCSPFEVRWIRDCDAFIVVYDTTSAQSLQSCRDIWTALVKRVRDGVETPGVLVGNKADLVDARQVTKEDGRSLARELGLSFLEASAINDDGVYEAVEAAVVCARQGGGSNGRPREDKRGGCVVA